MPGTDQKNKALNTNRLIKIFIHGGGSVYDPLRHLAKRHSMLVLNGDTEGMTIQGDIWDTMNELVSSAGLAIAR